VPLLGEDIALEDQHQVVGEHAMPKIAFTYVWFGWHT